MCQVVAYKRLKTMTNYNAISSKIGRGGSNFRALTGKNMAFLIGGRLWELVTYEKWSHMEVRL